MDFDKPKVYGDTFISDGLVDMKNGWSSVLTIICAAEHKGADFQIADIITFMIYCAPLAGKFQLYFRNEKSLEFLLTDSPAFGSQNYLEPASLLDLCIIQKEGAL